MDQQKIGNLIRALRTEKHLTQKQLADAMGISDRAVSKWERGLGCPDVSLLPNLAVLLGVPIEKMLEGELLPNLPNGGNMKRMEFYCCPTCGNIVTATATAQIGCCGRALQPLKAAQADELHQVEMQEVDGETYLTFSHPMTKEHYIQFVALVGFDRVQVIRLYPEQGGEVRLPRVARAKVYLYCTEHGFFQVK